MSMAELEDVTPGEEVEVFGSTYTVEDVSEDVDHPAILPDERLVHLVSEDEDDLVADYRPGRLRIEHAAVGGTS